jgi:hypothetical protein
LRVVDGVRIFGERHLKGSEAIKGNFIEGKDQQ